MKNLKNVMVALAAAMLATTVAPFAAAHQDPTDCESDINAGPAGLASGSFTGLPVGERDLFTIDLSGSGAESKQVTVSGDNVPLVMEVYLWDGDSDDPGCTLITTSTESVVLAAGPNLKYRFFIENPATNSEAADYTLTVSDFPPA